METYRVIIHCALISVGHTLTTGHGNTGGKLCASVHCSKNFLEPNYASVEPDCGYLGVKNSDAEMLNTSSSFQVNPGCSLTACHGYDFKGKCVKFTDGFFTLPDTFGNISSLNCSCSKMEMTKLETHIAQQNSSLLLRRKKRDICGVHDDDIQYISGRDLNRHNRNCQQRIRNRQRELRLRAGGGTAYRPDSTSDSLTTCVTNRTDLPCGCLKEHTKILMTDFSEKPVQLLEVGDMVMDHTLSSVRVSGVLKKFLMQDSFHGFDNQTFFFTDTHQLVGRNGGNQIQIYAKDLTKTIKENPLLAYLEVRQLPETSEILHFDSGSHTVEPETVTVFTDPRKYSESSLVYIILVDSEIGTYIANGFVCRHEIPPMEHWPITMSLLFSLVSETDIKWIEDVPYTLEAVRKIEMIVDQACLRLDEVLQAEGKGVATNLVVNKHDVADRVITEIFSNPTFSAFAVGVYGKLGPLLAKHLDGIEATEVQNPHVDQVKVYEQLKVYFAEALSDGFASMI